jgi:hypothetical protein
MKRTRVNGARSEVIALTAESPLSAKLTAAFPPPPRQLPPPDLSYSHIFFAQRKKRSFATILRTPHIVTPANAGAHNRCIFNMITDIRSPLAHVSSVGGYGSRLTPG